MGDIILGNGLFTPTFEEIKESWRIIEETEKMRDKIKFVTYKDYSNPELTNNENT